jgi:hypothetical protein
MRMRQPLTEELITEMERRAKALALARTNPSAFWASPSFKRWSGLIQTTARNASEHKRRAFLEEWHATLQELRDIGAAVSLPKNRPSWISGSSPPGAQADQFLHAHYYQRTFDGRRASYAAFFAANKGRRDAALAEALK